ncbi:MAG: RusA family crossover junction endodeoxyribonuclease [Pseudomonadota bacterium]
MNTITVTLPPAVSANVYWRTRVVKKIAMTYVSAEAKAFKAEVAALLRAAGVVNPFPGRVAVSLRMYPHRPLDWQKRQRTLGASWDDGVRSIDLDNSIKVTLDAMKGIAFVDDVWVRQITAERMEPDALPARVVVTVTAIPTAQPQMELV